MSANPVQRKTPWILALVLLSQVILMSYNARRADSEQSILRTWIMTPLSFIERGFSAVASAITGTIGSYVDLRHARAENIELREKNEQLLAELNDARERAAELDRIRTQIALSAHTAYRELAANVIARDTSNWFRRITIDRGTLDGVRLNMPVTTSGGVVGRVVAVGPNFAMVQVITDKQAGIGAMLQGSRAMGEVRGLDNASRCELKNVRTGEQVQESDAVVTTGLDRIYPKGLLIGTVESVDSDASLPYNRIIVKPTAPLDRLEHVLVLLVEQKDLKKLEEEVTDTVDKRHK